ncbi:MAG: esterase/lipase family protein [Bryobacteraceae bacterium]
MNIVQISSDEGAIENPVYCDPDLGNSNLGTVSIHFDALAPVVLVHGWNSDPSTWGSVLNPCPGTNTGGGFTDFLSNRKAPFDCSIAIDKQSSIANGGSELQRKLQQVLAQFGSRRVHLIAHSKGGLWVRQFLALNEKEDSSTQIGVLSATTVDTPHHGSVLATYANAKRKRLPGSPTPVSFLYFLSRFKPGGLAFFGAGVDDMTFESTAAHNSAPPLQTKVQTVTPSDLNFTVQYSSVSADADTAGTGTPVLLPYSFGPPLIGHLIANALYRWQGNEGVVKATISRGKWQLDAPPSPAGFNPTTCS